MDNVSISRVTYTYLSTDGRYHGNLEASCLLAMPAATTRASARHY